MPTQVVLLQPQGSALVAVANDDACNATVIKSDDDTNSTETKSDDQGDDDEGRKDGECRDDDDEHSKHDGNHNIPELPEQSGESERLDEPQVVNISSQDLGGFEFPFQKTETLVEMDSQSVRAQPRGRVAGTETAAFDFESQKVLITPEFFYKSQASSPAPVSSTASLRRHNTGHSTFDNDLHQDAIEQPKMFHMLLSEIDVIVLGDLMNDYETGSKGSYSGRNGFQKPLHTIAFMAFVAEKRGIWGPFLVVALGSMLERWVQEINTLVPNFKAQCYWGTANDRELLRKFWDLEGSISTQNSLFHICVTSYQLVLSDAAYFQNMRWQFVILDDRIAMRRARLSEIQDIIGFYGFKGSYRELDGLQVDQRNTIQNVEHSLIRKRKAHSSKRNHERVDGLEHLRNVPAGTHGLNSELVRLVPASPAVGGKEIEETQPLHGIAYCLIRLNIHILVARDVAHNDSDYSHFSRLESNHMSGLITADECKEWYSTPGILMDSAQEVRLAEYVSTYSREQIIQRIRDPKALPYMTKLFELGLLPWETWKGQKRMAENDPDFVPPPLYKEKGKAEYVNICVYNYRLCCQRLRHLYNITLQLQKYSIVACSSGLLDDISLRQLKAKMTALQPGFQEACEALGCSRAQLVWDTQPWW
jgi:hypothetical protein